MRETWYVLEDGTKADPVEVAPDEQGVLRHSGGVAVAMRNGVPSSYSVDPDEERGKSKEVTAEKPKSGYKTREAKAK
jgi:hypothetical protein